MSQRNQAGAPGPGPKHDSYLTGRLASFADGELRRDARDRVLEHLANCPKCKAEADAQRRLRRVSTGLSPESMPPFVERLVDGSDVVLPEGGSDVTLGRERQPREPRAERWASLAARIAGEGRGMHTAWLADLEGAPEDGVSLTAWQQRQYAFGVLVAAVRCRLRDSLGGLWYPVDWVLATRNRQETAIGVPPALLVVYIAEHDGVHTLLTEGWGWVGGCGVAVFALVRWLQRVRGIELAGRSSSTGD